MNDSYSPPPPSLAPGSRVWAYLRDSGGPNQTESVPQQEKEIIAYSKRHNLYLEKIFRDIAKSGGSTDKRDDFLEMIDLSKDKTIRPDGILIWNFARFSRDLDDSTYYKATIRRRGIVIHSLTDQIPADDFGSRIVETVIDFSNEEKRRQLSRDVKRGLKDLVNKGKGFAPGTPPRGYKAEIIDLNDRRDGRSHNVSKWIPDPALSEFVKLAWELRAAGKSYAEITKATKGRLFTVSASWTSFFQNKSYLGFYGKYEVPDHHEPLINQEVWEAVQRLNESHPLYGCKGLHHPRRVGRPSLLTGFTFCECGAMMTHSKGYAKKAPWDFYICGKKNRQGNAACNSRRVGATKVEARIIEAVKNKILTPEYMAEAIETARQNMQATSEIEREITAERRRIEDLDIAIHRLLRTIEKTDSPSALELLQQREMERAQVKTNIDWLSLQLATVQIDITPSAREIILSEWRDQFNKLEEAGSIRELRALLMQYIRRIEISYNHFTEITTAKIYYTYPMTETKNTHYATSLFGGTT